MLSVKSGASGEPRSLLPLVSLADLLALVQQDEGRQCIMKQSTMHHETLTVHYTKSTMD